MDLATLSAAVRPLWVVWLPLLFVGIVAWTLWPRRRAELEAHGAIPLKDE